MNYQIVLKQYKETTPVLKEIIPVTEGESTRYTAGNFPCTIVCTRRKEGEKEVFCLHMKMNGETEYPVSLALAAEKESFDQEEYIFFPAAVYDGNRLESCYLPYPPYHSEKTADGWKSVITDIPHLDSKGEKSRIQLRSGDMSTPTVGFYDKNQKEAFLMLAKHREAEEYTGFAVERQDEKESFIVSVPAVREEIKYFFGELPDGSGFYPTSKMASDDRGILLKKGEELELTVVVFRFPAENLTDFFKGFRERREELETGSDYASIPFSKAYDTVKKKYIEKNFTEEGYYRVGTENDAPPSYWQAGWVGGGMNTWPFLQEDCGTARKQALSTVRFIVEKLQRENGWYIPMYAEGKIYGDDFRDTDRPVLLVRKDADLLYFLLKQVMYLEAQGEDTQEISRSIYRQAEAFVRLYEKNGQIGQFIDMEKETLIQGDTACGAMAPAAMALASEYFGEERFLKTAEALGELYQREYLEKGFLNGGPGEICQAPDSESAFAFLESCVQLYETTGKETWLKAAEEAFELAVTWVISYDFAFPEESTAFKMGAHTMGTVFANAQNKHSAPGICTLSGNSMLKLYRFTGDKKYLQWLGRISHALSQFVSLPERPVNTLAGKPLPPGYFNERVQTSDWEGKETIGEFLYGSNWPETTMLLTYVEVPGIYLDLDRGILKCFDHVQAKVAPDQDGKVFLNIVNPTIYDAKINLLIDHSKTDGKLGHLYYEKMQKIQINTGEKKKIPLF